MCRSKAQGGQRCFAHAAKNLNVAKSRYDDARAAFAALSHDPAADPTDREKAQKKLAAASNNYTAKQIEMASTPNGARRFEQQRDKAAAAGDVNTRDYYDHVLRNGAEMRAAASKAYAQYKADKAAAQNATDADAARALRFPAETATTTASPTAATQAPAPAPPSEMSGMLGRLGTGGRLPLNRPVTSVPGTPERVHALQAALPTGGLAALLRQRGPQMSGGNLSSGADGNRAKTQSPVGPGMAGGRAGGTGAAVLPRLRAQREQFRSALAQAQAHYAAEPSEATLARYQQAREAYQHADRAFLRSLPRPPASTDFRRPELWAASTGGNLCDRTTAWRSIELHARDHQAHQVAQGAMTQQQFQSEISYRAHARQAVLDREGRGEFDPVNPRFAQQERARREQMLVAA